MVWGGFLNKDGTKFYRFLRKADNCLKFLEKLKEDLQNDEQKIVNKTIEIITTYINEISESKNEYK